MVVNSSTSSVLVGQSKKTNRLLSKVLERLSTGRRINRASDDAAGLAVAESLSSQVRGFRQGINNSEYATAAMQIGEGASNEISSMLQRQRELAVQASNDTLTNDQRDALNTEYQQLTEQIDQTAQSAQFNGQGTAGGTDIASGSAEVLVGANAGENITLPGVDFTASNIGVSGTSIATATDARNAINSVDNAITNVGGQRSTMGAMLNRFEHVSNNLHNQSVNTQSAESMIRDMDFAVGVAEMVRSQLLSQTNTMAMSNFNQINKQNMMALLR